MGLLGVIWRKLFLFNPARSIALVSAEMIILRP